MNNSLVKERVTVTLSPKIVRALDEKRKAGGYRSRSAALEDVLTDWEHAEAVRKLEEETAEYYRNQTPEDRAEDDEWVEFAGRAAMATWPEP